MTSLHRRGFIGAVVGAALSPFLFLLPKESKAKETHRIFWATKYPAPIKPLQHGMKPTWPTHVGRTFYDHELLPGNCYKDCNILGLAIGQVFVPDNVMIMNCKFYHSVKIDNVLHLPEWPTNTIREEGVK